MNLNYLNYFVTLAHVEHYTRAAEMLSITQPSLSHAIDMLEQELGTNLFQKQGRNVVLTKYGRIFLRYVEESLEILEAGIKKTKSMTSTTSGMIDLAYIYKLGSEFVPRLVNEFRQQHREMDIQFRFTVGSTADIIQGLKEERYDIAFCSKREEEKDIRFIPITQEEIVVIVPIRHVLASRESVDLNETLAYPQIMFTQGSGQRQVIDMLFRKIKAKPQPAYELEDDGAIAGLVAEDFGIAVMPNVPILKNLNVKILKIANPHIERYIYMAQMKNKYLAPVVREFSEFVRGKEQISQKSL